MWVGEFFEQFSWVYRKTSFAFYLESSYMILNKNCSKAALVLFLISKAWLNLLKVFKAVNFRFRDRWLTITAQKVSKYGVFSGLFPRIWLSVQKRANTDQEKLRIWIFLVQWLTKAATLTITFEQNFQWTCSVIAWNRIVQRAK